MNINELEQSIIAAVDECDAQARGIAGRSQMAFRNNAKPGSVIPSFGEFEGADDDAKESIRESERAAYYKVCAEIDRFTDAAMRKMSAPASADDVATVQLTLSRKSVTRDELVALYDRYKGNHQLAAAIADKAAQLEYYGIGDASEYFPSDAKDAAARYILSRSVGGNQVSPAMAAKGVIQNLRHVDIFGKRY